MNPVIQCSAGIVSFIPGSAFSPRNNNSLTILNFSRKPIKHGSSTRRYLLPPFVSIGLISHNKRRFPFHQKYRTSISATETDVAVEGPDSPVANEDIAQSSESPSDEVEITEDLSPKSDVNPASSKTRRTRSPRKSEMPPVKNEDLVPGATFTGKVRSIQPFGAFVDFGAFTDGLVHVSRLSDSYVSDVASVVSIGQEVKVKLIDVNTESQRISLSMRENDDIGKLKQQKDTPINSEKAGPGRRNTSRQPRPKKDDAKKSTKFVKGQDLEGTVKNMTRSGAFISLPEGEEGFLPISEESDDGFESVMGNTSLQVGQEVSVRVLRIARGQVTLTMKKEEEIAELDSKLSQGVVHVATNPFVLAFRKNKDIATFLDERENVQKTFEKPTEEIKETVLQGETVLDVPDVQDAPVKDNVEDDNSKIEVDAGTSSLDSASTAIADDAGDPTSNLSSSTSALEGAIGKEATVTFDGATSGIDDGTEDNDKILAQPTAVVENSVDDPKGVQEQTPVIENEKTFALQVDDAILKEDVGASPLDVASTATADVAGDPISNISSSTGIDGATGKETTVTSDGATSGVDDGTEESGTILSPLPTTVVESSIDDPKEEVQEQISGIENEKSSALQVDGASLQEDVEASSLDVASTAIADDAVDPISNISSSTSGVDGATGNEVTVTFDGATSGIDDGTEDNDKILSPQPIASSLQVDDATGKEDVGAGSLDSASTAIAVDAGDPISNVSSATLGLDSAAGEEATVTLDAATSSVDDGTEDNDKVLSQPTTVVNDSVGDIEDVQEQTPAIENEQSFALQVEGKEAGVASQQNDSLSNTNGKSGNSASEQDLSKAAISPALVKQLREETGAGMMDCKKALSETGGDIIKAQEFLRKKGLASADKKASRVTAEGRIGSYIHDSRIGILVEVNCETDFVSRGEIFKELVDDIAMQVAACPQVEYLATEDVPEEIVNKEKEIEMQKEDLASKPEQIRSKIVEGRIRKRLEELALLEQPYIKNDKLVVKDMVKQTIATIGENIIVKRFVRFNLGEGLEKKSQDFAAEVAAQTAAKPVSTPEKPQPAVAEAKETEQKPSTVAVSAALVKQLREETGAGMMDCKKALAETGGDLQKAQEYLRKKGLSSAEKKSSRLAAEGRIGSYIHDSRIGVLIEVNCETDFVGRSEKFKELVDDLAMQVVACPQVQFVSIEDIPESIVKKEKELEMQREDILSKPENIRERIVEGRISKRLGELALLEQPFIKDDNVLVKDLVKQTVAAIGENIKVRRFVRFTLGETAKSETIPSS